jgi:TonB family protein
MTSLLLRRSWIRRTIRACRSGTPVILLAAVGLVLAGCRAPRPGGAEPGRVPSPEEQATSGAEVRVSPGTFTPFIIRPQLRDPDGVITVMERAYSAAAHEAEGGGTVELLIRIDEAGRPQRTLVNQSSGQEVLDRMALQAVDGMEFAPGLNRDRPTAVWVSVPVAFVAGDTVGLELPGVQAGEDASEWALLRERAREGFIPGQRWTGEITGSVTEAGTGEPLQWVQMYVLGTVRGTLSDREGRFTIRQVPAGELQVVAEFVGYGRTIHQVSLEPDGRVELAFSLQETPEPLPALVVRRQGKGRTMAGRSSFSGRRGGEAETG